MNLEQLLLLLFLNSLFIIGLYESTEPEGIFAKPHDFLEKYLPSLIYKPLLGCVYCMASVWGTLFFVFFFFSEIMEAFQKPEWTLLIFWIIYLFSLSGLNHLLYSIILYFRNKE